MKKIGIVLLILISLIGTLLGCGKQDVNKDLESIDASEIKQIELTGTTGGKDGNYSYFFSDKEVVEFIDLLNQVLHSRKANMQVNLPNEILAIKSYDYFYLRRETDELTAYEIEFSKYAELPNKHKISLIDDVSDNSNFICRLSSDEVSLPLIIRTRKLGDKMEVKGLNGKKKVKDIFIDKINKYLERWENS